MRSKRGFTLIELIVVIVVLGIVAGAISATFSFTSRSFVKSGMRSEVQFESRYAINEIGKYLGVAGSVWVYNQDVLPASKPAVAGRSYCYVSNHTIYLGIAGEAVRTYLTTLPDTSTASIIFSPFAPTVVSGTTTTNMVHITLVVDDFMLETDVFVQNCQDIENNKITDYRGGLDGIYIEFE